VSKAGEEEADAGPEPILAGRMRGNFEPLYEEIRLYAPIIGSDALALYCLLLTFRHHGGAIKPLMGYAWPGKRELLRMLRWSRTKHKGGETRLSRALRTLESVGLIQITTVGHLLDTKRISEETAKVIVPRTSEVFRRAKKVIIVHDPLKRADFEQSVSGWQLAFEERQDMAFEERQDMAFQERQTHIDSTHTDPHIPNNNNRQVVVADINHIVRDWLETYGITEPTLSELSACPYRTVRAWMLYLDSQDGLSPEQRRGILVERLRRGHSPPKWWELQAARLPCTDPTEEYMLAQAVRERLSTGHWPEDIVEIVGEANAESWLAVMRDSGKV